MPEGDSSVQSRKDETPVRVDYQTNATVKLEVLAEDQRVDIFQSALQGMQETDVGVCSKDDSSPNRERGTVSSVMGKREEICSTFSMRNPLLKSRKEATKTHGVQLTCFTQDEKGQFDLVRGADASHGSHRLDKG